MKRILPRWFSGVLLALAALLPLAGSAQEAPAAHGIRLRVDGAISPASADYVVRGLTQAAEEQAAVVVLELDTPGGLDKSMRTIIKAIMASPVPVVGYVAPGGSRAASAGTYILYACHVAAMAPGTNLGAATPIAIGLPGQTRPAPPAAPADGKAREADQGPANPAPDSAETRKALNDAVAYIRALAEQRGRNADWAEQAVRDAASIPAEEALRLKVIDLIAPNLPTLLQEIDGRRVATAGGEVELQTAALALRAIEPDWRSRFLGVIADPSVAYLLLLLGLGGLLFEGYSPGAILPGVVGAICLLLALYAFQMLPVNYMGLALIALGVGLIVAETVVPAYGALGGGGVVAFVIGSVALLDRGEIGGVPLGLLIGISLAAALLLVGIVWMALRARAQPVVSGREEMLGMHGVAVGDFSGRGLVHVHGERWQARSNAPLRDGQAIEVIAIDGLILEVKAAPAGPAGGA